MHFLGHNYELDQVAKKYGVNISVSAFTLDRSSRAGLFGSGSGIKLIKTSGLIRAWDKIFVLGAQNIIKIPWQHR